VQWTYHADPAAVAALAPGQTATEHWTIELRDAKSMSPFNPNMNTGGQSDFAYVNVIITGLEHA